jgi:hypothetical protein
MKLRLLAAVGVALLVITSATAAGRRHNDLESLLGVLARG